MVKYFGTSAAKHMILSGKLQCFAGVELFSTFFVVAKRFLIYVSVSVFNKRYRIASQLQLIKKHTQTHRHIATEYGKAKRRL